MQDVTGRKKKDKNGRLTFFLRHITLPAGCEVAPREQAKDKHVARQTGARIIKIGEKLLLNDSNGVAVNNINVLVSKETSVKPAIDYVKPSADVESCRALTAVPYQVVS